MVSSTDSNASDQVPAVPCSTTDDFYTATARRTLRRVLEDWLRRQRLTVTEFIHSATALQKFEGAGTAYQHAIQRMAVTLAGKTKTPVVQLIRSLTALTTSAMQSVYADDRKGLFRDLESKEIAALADSLESEPRGLYILNGTLARYLAQAESWDEKLKRILALRSLATPEGLLQRAAESLVVEILEDPVVLNELLGVENEFSGRLLGAIGVIKGHGDGAGGIAESLHRLGRHFARSELREARLILAQFVLGEVGGSKRLRVLSITEELEAFRTLTGELQGVPPGWFHADDLDAALSARSKRFVTTEALGQIVAGAGTPDVQLERLLGVESAIVGSANKRALTPFAVNLVGGRRLEDEMPPEYRGIPRLRRLADLQARVLQSGFADADRDNIAAALDAAASRAEAQGGYLAGLQSRISDPAERVDTLLKLFAARVFTEGALSRKVRRALLAAVASPGFIPAYMRGRSDGRQAAAMELVARLKVVGIPPEESLRAMAAG